MIDLKAIQEARRLVYARYQSSVGKHSTPTMLLFSIGIHVNNGRGKVCVTMINKRPAVLAKIKIALVDRHLITNLNSDMTQVACKFYELISALFIDSVCYRYGCIRRTAAVDRRGTISSGARKN